MFCCARGNHASTNLKKVLSWKPRQVYFINPFPLRLKLGKSLETCCVNFVTAWADILSEKNLYFGKHLFCITITDFTYKLRVQDFATGRNFSSSLNNFFSCVYIAWYRHERGRENSRQLCKPNCLELSQPLSCLYQAKETRKILYFLNFKQITWDFWLV